MNKNPGVFVNSAEEGLNKVKKEDFAYIIGKIRIQSKFLARKLEFFVRSWSFHVYSVAV